MQSTPELDSSEDREDEAATDGAPDTDPRRKAKGKIKFESVMQRSEAVAYFSALVAGLRQGQLQFRHGDEHLSLKPSEQVHVEVKASTKGDKEKVAFELEWHTGSAEKGVELDG